MGNLAVEALRAENFPSVTVVQAGKVLMAPLSECVTKADNNFIEYKTLAQTLSI